MAGLEAKASEQAAKYVPLLEKARKVKTISDNFYTYLGNIKDTLTEGVDTSSYTNLDTSAKLDERWFTGDRYTKQGDSFIAVLNKYKEDMAAVLEPQFSNVNQSVQNDFNISPMTNSEGKEIAWLKYNFEGFPLAASITRFTQMQNDVKANESEIYSSLYKDS